MMGHMICHETGRKDTFCHSQQLSFTIDALFYYSSVVLHDRCFMGIDERDDECSYTYHHSSSAEKCYAADEGATSRQCILLKMNDFIESHYIDSNDAISSRCIPSKGTLGREEALLVPSSGKKGKDSLGNEQIACIRVRCQVAKDGEDGGQETLELLGRKTTR